MGCRSLPGDVQNASRRVCKEGSLAQRSDVEEGSGVLLTPVKPGHLRSLAIGRLGR